MPSESHDCHQDPTCPRLGLALERYGLLWQLFESAPDAFLVTDSDWVIREVNRMASAMFNASREQLLTHALGEFLPRLDRGHFETLLDGLQKEGRDFWLETRLTPSKGAPRVVEIRLGLSSLQYKNEHDVLLWILRDITRFKQKQLQERNRRDQLEEEVRQHTTELERVNERLLSEIAERRQVEDTLRASEERFRRLTESLRQVVWLRSSRRILYVNPAYEQIWGLSRESLYENPRSFMELAHPDDREFLQEGSRLEIEEGVPFNGEYRIIRPDGVTRWIHSRSFPAGTAGDPSRMVGIAEDVTTRKEAEIFLRVERDLAFRLGSIISLPEAMELILEACLEVGCLDSGGIYVVDPDTGDLKLVCHRGLTEAFIQVTSHYDRDSLHAQFVRMGQPHYWSRPRNLLEMGQSLLKEGIKSLASIPVITEGEVVAVLNLASHTRCEIPQTVRSAVESIATQIAGIISRVRLGERIEVQGQYLREANVALRALVKQRERDRSELEGALLDNVKHMVLPYLEKLRESHVNEEQGIYLDALEHHLREITCPFIRKLSSDFIGLTPTELRVAEFIRAGRTSKEMAHLLGCSEKAIYFHRQSIRDKLNLKNKKINLRSYLATLG